MSAAIQVKPQEVPADCPRCGANVVVGWTTVQGHVWMCTGIGCLWQIKREEEE